MLFFLLSFLFFFTWEDYYILDEQIYETERLDITCDYSYDGILESYIFRNEGHEVLSLTLRKSVWDDYWLLSILLTIAFSAIIIVFLFFFVIKGKRPIFKKAKIFATPSSAKKELHAVNKESELNEIKTLEKPIFCPYCGKSQPTTSKYCVFCGNSLER